MCALFAAGWRHCIYISRESAESVLSCIVFGGLESIITLRGNLFTHYIQVSAQGGRPWRGHVVMNIYRPTPMGAFLWEVHRYERSKASIPLHPRVPCAVCHATCDLHRAICVMRCAICVVRCASCDMRSASCDVRHATCDVRRTMCVMRRAICVVRCALCDVRHATCDMRSTSCDMHRAMCNMRHATCIMW